MTPGVGDTLHWIGIVHTGNRVRNHILGGHLSC